MELIGFSIAGAVIGIGSLLGYYEARRANKTRLLVKHLKQYNPLYLSDRWDVVRYRVDTVQQANNKWQRNVLLVTHKRIAIYPYAPPDAKVKALFTIQPHELRGFWRPVKYTAGENEIWIHAQIGDGWHILKLTLYQYEMQKLVRALKEIGTEEQVTAYRRRRPYLHIGLTQAFPATQTLTGAWELSQAIQLYIMPLYLLVFDADTVQTSYNLAKIQDIGALKRMEGGKPAGLVRFFYENELRAFAMDDYEAWAASLAEAAKRTLEEPVIRKQKSKDDEDDFDL